MLKLYVILLTFLWVSDTELNGYKYLFYSIELIIKNEDLLLNLNNLYYLVAKRYNRTPRQVQDHIRYNIKY